MPNPWTGKGNPYTRKEVIERLRATLKKGQAIIAAGAGTGISAKFIERGGADLIIIYNSGRFRMSGHGSTCGLMSYGDANAIAMEIGEFEVLPVVEEVPVICGVHATDPRRRMWHFLGQVKDMGFSGVNRWPVPAGARRNRHEREKGIRNGRARPQNGSVQRRLCCVSR
jgi:predicted TIM-barrel enzyme